MRFERQEELDRESHCYSSSWSPIERTSLFKKRSYFEFEEDSMYGPVEERTAEENFEGAPIDEQFDDEMAEEDVIPEEFRLGNIKWPSRSNSKWYYRWRGIDTQSRETKAVSDDMAFEIRFSSNRGLKITGTFGSPGDDWNCGFEGVKVEAGREPDFSIEESWDGYS